MGVQGQRRLVAALCGLAFVLRMVGIYSQSLWRDEIDAIRFAFRPLDRLLETFATPGQNGPLYSLVLRPWLGLAGDDGLSLRFFSLFFGVLAVPLIYRLGRRLFPSQKSLPLIAALLAATSPYLVWYGQEGKMYTLVVALALLSMDRYLAALDTGGWQRWLAYVLATSALFYVHLMAALIVPAQVLLFLLLARRRWSGQWRPWLTSIAILTLPYLPLLVWQLPLLLRPAETGFQFVPLHQLAYSLLVNYSLGVIWGGHPWILALLVGLLLAGGMMGKETGLRRYAGVVLAVWLVVPVVALFAITLVRPLFTARYLIFVLPALLLLLALGVTAVARQSRLLALSLLVGLVCVNGRGLWQQATKPIKADFRAATLYITQHKQPEDLLLFQIPYGRYSFDYYYARSRQDTVSVTVDGRYRAFLPRVVGAGGGAAYRWADGLYTNAGMAPEVADRLMTTMTDGSCVVWFVATETSMWDERGLVQQWLETHAARTDEAHFTRVSIYRYTFP